MTTRLQHEAKLKAKLDSIPRLALPLAFVLIHGVLLLFRLLGLILCGGVAYQYAYTQHNPDLALVWVMLGILSIPVRHPKSTRTSV